MSGVNRIIKNTIFLYARMAIIMFVSLFTTRIVIAALGIEDYGIYSVVGSVVTAVLFLQNSLNSATQRFLSYEIGKGETAVQDVFSMSLNIHILFMICAVLLFETFGLWFLNHVLSVPANRLFAANVVYQLSVLTFCINLLRIPYNAIVISYEKMNVYAIISIAEAAFKLGIVYLLWISKTDKLILYSILTFVVTALINIAFMIYGRIVFYDKCIYVFRKDRKLFKTMLSFSNWNLIGGLTGVATSEGPGYFVNVYLGVGANAAIGIAKQVGNAIYSFSSNFQIAFNPQIIKSYSSGDLNYMHNLMFLTSKVSFFLLFVIGYPIVFYTPEILDLWLVEVPVYTVAFCQLTLISEMITAMAAPLWMAVHAIGDIKKYQLVISGINICIIPISFVVLALHLSPNWIFIAKIIMNGIIFFYRVSFIGRKMNFPVTKYLKQVLCRCLALSCAIVLISLALNAIIPNDNIGLIISIVMLCVMSVLIFFFGGINKDTRHMVFVKLKIKK